MEPAEGRTSGSAEEDDLPVGNGRPVASGVYFARAEVAGMTTNRELLLLR